MQQFTRNHMVVPSCHRWVDHCNPIDMYWWMKPDTKSTHKAIQISLLLVHVRFLWTTPNMNKLCWDTKHETWNRLRYDAMDASSVRQRSQQRLPVFFYLRPWRQTMELIYEINHEWYQGLKPGKNDTAVRSQAFITEGREVIHEWYW
jgi:hypothetical protein